MPEDLLVEKKTTGAVLVVGGGIGGMQAALDLANSGYLVHLITEEPSIGGKMARLDKTFPTNDCAMCLMGPRMTDTQNHPNIKIHTLTSLEGLSGEAGNFKVTLRERARYVNIEECTACGDCEQVCPVTVPNTYNEEMDTRKAVYKLFPQAVPNKYLIEKRGIPPCRATCPAGTNVQGYTALISQGKFKEALEVVMRRLPYPGICGRICHHPCESECNRAQYDEPIAIATLKRAAADYGWEGLPPVEPVKPWQAEKVAIIGGGPAGMTAAADLVARGYRVTVFDANDLPGGMMLSAIPRYRLSRDIVARESQRLLEMGIEFRGQTVVGRDITLAEIRSQFDAVLVAVGTQKSRSLNIEGISASGVLLGLDFLKAINAGQPPAVGRRVLVIGGGNVAMDVARSALRLGAAEVHVASLEARHEMPAHSWEIEEALEEGIVLHPSWGPKRILQQDGKVTGVEMLQVSSVFDENRRFNPKFIPNSEKVFEADTVILAIGQTSDLSFLPADLGLEVTRGGTIVADPLTKATAVPGIFACGDVVSGPASVVEAIAAGHEAAISIERYLSGQDLAEGRSLEKPEKLGPPEGRLVLASRRRQQRAAPVAERIKDFREVLLGFTPEVAQEEAKRCLNCGVCSECLQCETACKKKAIEHWQRDKVLELDVGAVILAPGYELFEAELKGEYGYGVYPNVVTSLEFERLLSATGPTKGALRRPSDGKHPHRIAFLQCVGSRDTAGGAEYCSSICCMYSTKEAIIAREHDREVQASIFYLDLRSYGKNFDRYVDSAKNDYGVRYIRSFISRVRQEPKTKNLIITYYEGGQLKEEEFDLVVLAVGVRPPKKARELAQLTGIRLNQYGFAWTEELDPVVTSRPGIFVAGAFAGPRDIPETVMTASAAAARAAALLSDSRGTMVSPKVYPPERDVAGEEPRVGAFICRCGINIGGVVDVPAVVETAQRLPGVVHAQEFTFTCSQDSIKRIKELIEEKNLNRVVVASCTIRTHQPLFREALREAGLNPFLFEMANIREQDSWVHRDQPDLATAKAKDLVKMAVAKVKKQEPLYMQQVPVVPKALIIGGGPAGLTAAAALADQGIESYIVEREGELGGFLRRLRTSPEGQDLGSYLRDLLRRVDEDPRIHVFTRAEVAEVSGHAGHFKTVVTLRGRMAESRVELEHGVIILATGTVEARPQEYLYGQDPRVLTQTELENRLADGEHQGLNRVAMIQCVGSRDDKHRYCSRTCCTQAVKNALAVKKANPAAEVYVLYRDMRTYSFMEKYYKEAREQGVLFLRYDEGEKPRVSPGQDGLKVEVVDQSIGQPVTLAVDTLVLATAAEPPAGVKELATVLKVPLNEDGFFMETHAKLGPMDFPSQGIYMAGAAHSPKFLWEAVYQAEGAVARAMNILAQPSLTVGGVVAVVDEEKCAACLTCVRVCPFNVPFINERRVAEINPVQCHGCGSCAAECPAKAIQLQNYKDAQILAKIRGLFELSEVGG